MIGFESARALSGIEMYNFISEKKKIFFRMLRFGMYENVSEKVVMIYNAMCA